MRRLFLSLAVVTTLLTLAAGPVGAHQVQTPVGCVSLAPGHFAAAGGHETAIAHSGGAVAFCETPTPILNPNAPADNPGVPPGHQ